MPEGRIKWFNPQKRYGRIEFSQDREIFVHINQWQGSPGSWPQEGQQVKFHIGKDFKGREEAQDVRPVDLDRHRFLNPYNFVRYLDKPKQTPDDDSPEQLLMWRCPPPPHDRYVGLAGRITCTMEAKTPLFISDSHAVEEEDNGHKSYRFFRYDGKPALPASSLRGMVRSVFEAVTNSCFSTIHDQQLGFRLEARRAPSLRPAVVKKPPNPEKQEDGEVLLLESAWVHRSVIEKAAKGVLTGHLKEAPWPKESPFSSYFNKVMRDHSTPIQAQVRQGVRQRKKEFGSKRYRFPFDEVVEIKAAGQPGQKIQQPQNNLFWGYLKITGPNVISERLDGRLQLRKHDERFFYWDGSPQSKARIPWQDIPSRKNAVQRYNAVREEQKDPANQQLPYVTYLPNEILSVNDLVWVEVENGVVMQIGSVCIPKFRYRQGVLDLSSKYLHPCQRYERLCPVCRVFGWVREDAENIERNIPTAYAGRVRLSHGTLTHSEGTLPETPLAILSTPKPTTTEFYLLNSEGKPDFDIDYDDKNARLRGRKFYRHHSEIPDEQSGKEEYRRPNGERDNQNRTVRDALKKGATFKFIVGFENLAPVELGALFYALELEDDLVHRLGYAKPLGFGSVKVTVEEVETVNWRKRLESLEPDAGWQVVDPEQVVDLKDEFLQAMRALYGDEFDGNVLADLHALLREPPDGLPVHYPRPSEEPDPEGKSYEWFMGNQVRKQPLPLASEDRQGFPIWDKKRK